MNAIRWFRTRRLKGKVRRAKACLRWIDRQMARLGCPAWKRQQMRRDIVTSDKAWIDCLDLLMGEKPKRLTKKQMTGSKRIITAALTTVEEKP